MSLAPNGVANNTDNNDVVVRIVVVHSELVDVRVMMRSASRRTMFRFPVSGL